MTAYPSWTPASRPGIVPLHPYGFGTILARSFVSLRHNPKVLLGFALAVQAVAYIVLTAAIGAVAVASFSRLDTLPLGSDDYTAVFWGSTALTGATGLVLGLLVGALSVIVQGVVVAEVAHAVVAEKPRLAAVWTRVRPVIWRLIGYSFLTVLASVIVIGIIAGIVALLVISVVWLGVLVGVLLGLALIPLYLWLTTKLFLVPSVIILEKSGIGGGIARSWRLTRGRFWSTLGVIVVVSLAFGIVAQVISVPVGLVTGVVSSIVSPTGETGTGAIVTAVVVQIVGQLGVLLVQCIALVVQSTSAALVYVDARMRVEGLDHDLHTYVEARDAGATDLPDPYLVGVGRVLERPAPTPLGPPPPYAGYPTPAGQPYAGQPYAGQPYAGQPVGPGAPAQPGAATTIPPAYGAPAQPAWGAPPSAATAEPPRPAVDGTTPRPPSTPTNWAAPGSSAES